ncbi:hypothetical protein Pmani_001593 [Petrolisthes manimaculis]|uniref:EML-like second beta-propeller domain-containing protein n=1 Tax=Petrolisthes manimaculis TaxID=1843537 RepID=A0AAE1URV1_9EUCA|nr:hypothetical protein Pmani_001593 [Petrolisthes manimaculis]
MANTNTNTTTNNKMGGGVIEAEYLWGVRGEVGGCVVHVDQNTVVYPAGAFLVLHNTTSHQQQFVSIAEEAMPTALAISPKRQYLCVCRGGESPAVSVWDVEGRKRLRFLSCGEMTSDHYVSAAFTQDEKMVAAQGGAPDWTLVLFLWEKGKVFSVLRLSDTPGLGPVASLTCHPEDNGVLSVVGERVLKLFRLNDKLLKTWGYQGGHNYNSECQVWADQHTLLVGTDNGSVLVLEEGELRTELQVSHPQLPPSEKRASSAKGVGVPGGSGPCHRRVTALVVFSGGFLCACGPDKIFVFQKSEDINEHYFQRYMLRVCEASPAALVSGRGEHNITALTLCPAEKTVVAATHTNQLFSNPLPSLDAAKLPSLMFSPLHARLHEGGVVDADTCLWKPVVVTGGTDRTLRVWDYQNHTLLLTHTFREDIFSLAIHPTGLHVAVGLTDTLRLHHMLFDTLRVLSEVRIRRCSACCYSPGGNTLAAADGHLVILTSTITLKKLHTLKGHTAKVSDMGWYPDGSAVIGCAEDGTVIGWDTCHGQSLWQVNSLESCKYLAAGLSLDGNATQLVGHEGSFTEITGGQMVQEMNCTSGGEVVSASLSPVKTLVAMGTSTGHLLLNKFPLHMATSTFTTIPAHVGPISKVVVTGEEGRVVTCGRDGAVVVWRLAELDDKSPGFLAARERLQDLPSVPEMLVSREDLERTRDRMEELERNVSYQVRDKEVHLGLQQQEFLASKDALLVRHQAEVDKLHQIIQEGERERERLEASHRDALEQVNYEHQGVFADHQQELRKKLLYEYSKQDKLETRLKEMQLNLDRQVAEAEHRTREELQQRLNQQDKVVTQLTADLEKTTAELERERTEGAEVLRLVEASTEAELGQVRSSLHAQLVEEHDNVIKLRSERAALRKNFVGMQRECEQKEGEVRGLVEERGRLQATVKGLEREVEALRREVNHRDDIIREREGSITSSREQVVELEKQKFLLQHQMELLREELHPLQAALDLRAQQVKQLEEEMGETRLVVGARERQVKELSQKVATAGKTGRHLEQRHHTLATALTRVLADLATTTHLLHHPKKLKDAVKSLNDKYIRSGRHKEFWTRPDLDKLAQGSSDLEVGVMGEDTAVPELLRQREMLERSVATLRAQSIKQTAAHKDRVTSLVKENRELVGRVGVLEERVWQLEGQTRQLESVAGLRDPYSGKRRASRDHLVQQLAQQADTITRLTRQLRLAQTQKRGDGDSGGEMTTKEEEMKQVLVTEEYPTEEGLVKEKKEEMVMPLGMSGEDNTTTITAITTTMTVTTTTLSSKHQHITLPSRLPALDPRTPPQ